MLKKLLIPLFLSLNAMAISLPTEMSYSDRLDFLKIVGLPASAKLLSSPYPVGGKSGLEVGIGQTVIGTEELATKGAGLKDSKDFSLTQINITKGLYRDFDIGVEFTPMTTFQVQSFGFQARTVISKSADSSPVLSLFLFTTNTNFKNLVQVETYGIDFVGSVHTEKLSIYAGVGNVRTFGKFIGGDLSLNASENTETSSLNSAHLFLGTSVQFKPYFLSVQMDRYDQMAYSAKVGTRF